MTIRNCRATRVVREDAGAVLVEFSLILLLLLLLVFGIIDFGRALYTANSINAAAREGARQAAVMDDPVAAEAAIKDTVIAHVYLLGGRALLPEDVTVTYNYASEPAVLQSTTVSVHYPLALLTPVGRLIERGDTLFLRAHSQFRWELVP